MRLLIFLVGFIFSLTFASCQKELTWGGENVENPNPDSTSTNPSTANCKDCTFQPLCEGSIYNFEITTPAGTTQRTDKFHFLKDSTINGKVFKNLETAPGLGNVFYNCTDNILTLYGTDLTGMAGSNLPKMETVLLKANQPVGTTWTSTVRNPLGQNNIFTYKIEEKDINYSVLGKNYSNVIHVSSVTSVDGIEGSVTHYYFARNIGMIASEIFFMGESIYSQKLKSYSIP